jgi:hypothetical protein
MIKITNSSIGATEQYLNGEIRIDEADLSYELVIMNWL